jgi:tetratricopeptide (TPR) repeat protein
MRELRRALIVWGVLMGLFLLVVIWVSRHGDRAMQAVESRMKLTQGLELESLNRLPDAIRNYEDVVSADETAFRPRALLVRAYVKAGRFADALTHAQRGVEIAAGRKQLEPQLLLSSVYREMGRWDRAQSAAERAREVAPKCGEAHYELAKAAEAMRDYPRMVEELEEVARLGARGSSAEYEEAWALRRESIAEYETRVKQGDGPPGVYYRLGVQYKETGLWQDAVEAFAKAAAAGRMQADANFWLGVEAEVKGDLDGAIARYRKAVDTNPNHLQGLINLERALLLNQIEAQAADARTFYMLGQLNYRLKNWEKAARNFSKAIELDPGLADAHFRLGLVLQIVGRPTEARAAYAETVRLLPTHARALLALHRLESQQ